MRPRISVRSAASGARRRRRSRAPSTSASTPRSSAGRRRAAARRASPATDALPGCGIRSVVVVENERVAVPRDALHENAQGALHQELEPVAVTRARRVFVVFGFFGVFLRRRARLRVGGVPPRALSRRQRVRFLEALRGVAIIQAHARLHGAAPRDGHRRRRRRARAAEVLERQPVHGAHDPTSPRWTARSAVRRRRSARRPAARARRGGGGSLRAPATTPAPPAGPRAALAAQRQKARAVPRNSGGTSRRWSPRAPRPGEPRARARPRAARGHRVRRALEPAARDVRQPRTVRADGAPSRRRSLHASRSRVRARQFHLMSTAPISRVCHAGRPEPPPPGTRPETHQVGARARRARAR